MESWRHKFADRRINDAPLDDTGVQSLARAIDGYLGGRGSQISDSELEVVMKLYEFVKQRTEMKQNFRKFKELWKTHWESRCSQNLPATEMHKAAELWTAMKHLPPEMRDGIVQMIRDVQEQLSLESNSDYIRTIGYTGEAVVYQKLLKCGLYQSVEWSQHSEEPTDLSVTVGGEKYYIHETGNHYDIVATDNDGKKHYFEVKSTVSDLRDFSLSWYQMQFLKTPSLETSKYLVRVHNALSDSPEIIFFQAKNIP